MTLKAGALSAKENIQKLINSEAADKIKNQVLVKQAQIVAKELGELKGSIMKVGQQLSVYGEHFLPPEAINALKTLQSNSPPVDWSIMEKNLKKEIGFENFQKLKIHHESIASASLGQVYKATWNDKTLAIKIQYPNLNDVIDADLKALKRVLGLLSFIPRDGKLDSVFVEIKSMLLQELDYQKEAEALLHIHQLLKDDPFFVVRTPINELSTKHVLAMSFEDGYRLDSPEVRNLSQDKRNHLAQKFLELYFRELFEFSFVQTDPHLGNYSVRIEDGQLPKLILYDYGAVKKIPSDFFNAYKKIIIGSIQQDRTTLIDGAMSLGLIKENDPSDLVENYIKLCYMFTEPFWKGNFSSPNCPKGFDKNGRYDYASSDLPKRIAAAGKEIIFQFKLRTPPKELLFLDRKMGGTYTLLSALGAKIDGRSVFDQIRNRKTP
jgi:predicted unusual protein kinase regulating ubiquinone biosynthesis (AarF/ABC1/UbiB family)